MKLHAQHELSYTYSNDVFLDPHTVYLSPKAYPHQRVIRHTVELDPLPSMLVKNIDIEGNFQHVAFFRVKTNHLTIRSEIVIESDQFNVFDFVLFPFETERIPFTYSEAEKKHLQPYLVREGVTTYVEQFARQTAAGVAWATVPFLTALCQHIARNFVYERREVGPPFQPEHTLIGQKGSCRDFAQLFVACCRSVGIAARFVSGYLYGNLLQAHDLHAWVEVYLPGAGWRGFDPTEGKAIVNNHIHLAASANPLLIAPVSGLFRGQARSSLQVSVNVQEWTAP
jgi:transglutaminase-like putative cysteine protease